MEFLTDLQEMGPTVVVVGMFLWYLIRKDNANKEAAKEGHEAAKELAVSVGSLQTAIESMHDDIRATRSSPADARRRAE